jgi:ribosomal protein S8
MTTTITLQIPDELAQQLQAEAQQQNTTIENLVAQRLMQNSGANPQAQDLDQIPAKYVPLLEMFNQINEAQQKGQDYARVAISTPFTRSVASSMVSQKWLRHIEVDDTQPDAPMTLYLSEKFLQPREYKKGYLDNFQTDHPRLKLILEKLRDPDPNIQLQGVQELGDLGREFA